MRREPSEDDAEVLLAMLSRTDDEALKSLLLEDLHWTTRNLEDDLRGQLLTRAAVLNLPLFAREGLDPSKLPSRAGIKRRPVDMLLITVKLPELRAVQLAFGIDFGEDPTLVDRQIRFWERDVEARYKAEPVRVAITMASFDANYRMAAFCASILTTYSPRYVVLVGMAAGVEGRVRLGDVVVADSVIDFGHGVLTPTGFMSRALSYSLDPNVARGLSFFDPHEHGWIGVVRELLAPFAEMEVVGSMSLPSGRVDLNPSFVRGTILSGDVLVEDGSLPAMREKYGDRVTALEMEGAGFAYTFDSNAIPWMVFRGIADFGGEGRTKEWQFVSAVAAAAALRVLVEKSFIFEYPESGF